MQNSYKDWIELFVKLKKSWLILEIIRLAVVQ